MLYQVELPVKRDDTNSHALMDKTLQAIWYTLDWMPEEVLLCKAKQLSCERSKVDR